jgi:CheY-like chemotaxis protein
MTPANLLIVEDEAIVALDLRLQLEELGYAVIGIAGEGEQALQMAAGQRPDLVLMGPAGLPAPRGCSRTSPRPGR